MFRRNVMFLSRYFLFWSVSQNPLLLIVFWLYFPFYVNIMEIMWNKWTSEPLHSLNWKGIATIKQPSSHLQLVFHLTKSDTLPYHPKWKGLLAEHWISQVERGAWCHKTLCWFPPAKQTRNIFRKWQTTKFFDPTFSKIMWNLRLGGESALTVLILFWFPLVRRTNN